MDLELAKFFVRVVQNNSFSKAADALLVPKSTVSKSITRLEKELGAKLLLRTTRSLTLTQAGQDFFNSIVGPIQSLEDAHKILEGRDGNLSGLIKITAPEDLGSEVISPLVASIARKYPGLCYDVIYTDEVLDLVRDGFDLAFRIGKLSESRFKSKKVGDIFLMAVASPAYLKSIKNKIHTPTDLEKYDCLSYSDHSIRRKWVFKNQKGLLSVNVNPRITSNQMTSLLKMAIAGAGIAHLPHYLCKREIESGRLIDILPEWRSQATPVTMISPLPFSSSLRMKTTTEVLGEAIQKLLLL